MELSLLAGNNSSVQVSHDSNSNSPNEEDEHANGSARTRSKDLSATQRQQIYEALLVRSNHGKLRRNATKIVAELFNVNRHAVWRIWR